MIGYRENVGNYTYHFMNIDGIVHLEKLVVTHIDGSVDYGRSWFRPVSSGAKPYERREVYDEPEITREMRRNAVQHFARQIRFKEWSYR